MKKKLFYGKGLFTKVFILFWFSVIVAGILMNIMSLSLHVEPEKRRLQDMGMEILENNGKILIYAYEHLGKDKSAKLRTPGYMWLFDSNFNNIYEELDVIPEPHWKKIPNNENNIFKQNDKLFKENKELISSYAKKIIKEKSKQVLFTVADQQLIGMYLASETGKEYAILRHWCIRKATAFDFINKFKMFWPIYLITSFIICFVLTRHIVKPLIEFREISKRFAEGDFEARVGKKATSRLDEIGDISIAFNDMADKISGMINSQKRLFSDISHELRSPLARLMVSIELLKMKIPKENSSLAERIEKEVNRMNSMIEEILRFSKLESGSEKYIFEYANIDMLILDICKDAEFEGQKKNCRFNMNIQKNIAMNCVPQLISRAIENIIRNALKHSPNDSAIEVELKANEENATINITDHGPGVPEENLEKLFEPFFSCSKARTPQQNGIGLGLAIADRAIKLHKGNIKVCNIKPNGFQVVIFLPLKN